jgi:RNA polymerase sigma factor (sigma-70 family)
VAGLTFLAGDRAAAEEAVQEALARAWERTGRGERIESWRNWVAVVATNVVRSGIRRRLAERRARQRLTAELAAAPSGADDWIDVARAIAGLPARQRQALVLRYFVDLPLIEIARALRTNEGAVKQLLHRARHSMAEDLGEDADDAAGPDTVSSSKPESPAEEASNHAGS